MHHIIINKVTKVVPRNANFACTDVTAESWASTVPTFAKILVDF
jgi:hypothetical protein